MVWLITVSYVVVAALLLSVSLSVRLPLVAKFGAILLVTACYGFTYVGFRALEGWPADESLPDDFRLQWITVDEPNKQTGEDGVIFFWVRHLNDYGDAGGEPRSYRVPWSEALAEQAEEALEKIEEGETLNGFITRQAMTPEEDEVDVTSEKRQGLEALGDEAMFTIEFRDVPKPKLPAKSITTS
jgi:hypothetical protein